MPNNNRISEEELNYLESLSEAVLHKTSRKSQFVLYLLVLTVVVFVGWSYITYVDEIVRSIGKVIPSGENKVLQNLEGGIIEDILVKEGDRVKQGQILLKIKNVKSTVDLDEIKFRYNDLFAQSYRLIAQATMKSLKFDKAFAKKHPGLVTREESLYNTNMNQLKAKIDVLQKQIKQKNDQLKEAVVKAKDLQRSYFLINEEINMTEPMVKEGIKSKVDFLKLQREANKIKTDINTINNSTPEIRSSIDEIRSKINETRLTFIAKSKQDLNDVLGKLDITENKIESYQDTVNRTYVRSPVEGIVKKMYVNTIGGVIRPGMDLIEVVPDNKNLIVEVKILPKDIAFIYYGQGALVKFTAYNYSIYGGLKGKVIGISPDTITDKDNKTYYIVRIKTDKDTLVYNGEKLKIIPGMTVNADIITGKRTIFDYIMKPILNSKDYIFTER
ncbi:MAG: HlyD family type I secretion periplasmic adaptor subunit [Sulfurospirillaceae bacterium]|nr:HlyD family type I secretion periplasmic adaptor subunit [Sulfurospirillaceae bacterium]